MKKTVLLTLCLLGLHAFARGQLCTGSLGDPIVNLNFGSSITTGLGPLRPGITSLSYTPSNCPNDGEYTMTNYVNNCFSNAWYYVTQDHTGNAGGLFMLINASVTPNDFYVDTVKGLCGNTTFEFAAWVMNILRAGACNGAGSKPNLTFRIETTTGTVLLKYDTGDLATQTGPVWKQYGTFFKTPLNVSTVVLRITNNAPGGCGNDLALDDITFRPCGPPISVTAGMQQATQLSFCEALQTPLQLNTSFDSTNFMNAVIQWQQSFDSGKTWMDIAGARSMSYTRQPTTSGLYEYRTVISEAANFSSTQCRLASNITSITVLQNPLVDAGPDQQIFEGQSVTLKGSITGSYSNYYWQPLTNMTSASTLNPVVAPSDSITYTLYAVPSAGCPAVGDAVFVKVYKNISVPNAFSPNGDGVNDTWVIKGLDSYTNPSITVFSREGAPVFQSRSGSQYWDGKYNGKPLPMGSYYYLIDLNIGTPPFSGVLVLIR